MIAYFSAGKWRQQVKPERQPHFFQMFAKIHGFLNGLRGFTRKPENEGCIRSNFGPFAHVDGIDNLFKGASGAAVQNFNVMWGIAETTALV